MQLLVVDDDRLFTSMTRRLCGPAVDVRVAATAHEALRLIASGESYDGAVIDLLLPLLPRGKPEPLGEEILHAFRQARPCVPVSFVTGTTHDRELVSRVRALDARFVSKEAAFGNVLWPMYAAVAAAYGLESFEKELFIERAMDATLASLEPEIIALAVLDVPRGEFAKRLGTSESNVRRYVTRICAKMKSTEVLEIGASIRRGARLSRSGRPPAS